MEWQPSWEEPRPRYLQRFDGLLGDVQTRRTFQESIKGILAAGRHCPGIFPVAPCSPCRNKSGGAAGQATAPQAPIDRIRTGGLPAALELLEQCASPWVAAGFLYQLGVTLEWAEVQLLAKLGGWVPHRDRPQARLPSCVACVGCSTCSRPKPSEASLLLNREGCHLTLWLSCKAGNLLLPSYDRVSVLDWQTVSGHFLRQRGKPTCTLTCHGDHSFCVAGGGPHPR